MPAIYTSFLFEESDDLETKMRKLYLGVVSLGEDLYTFNAALNEMRKTHDRIDKKHQEIERSYREIKRIYKEQKDQC